jgi:hypothetical protein
MIIVKLMGGLGNQMFQYAAARRVALRLGTCVKFDLSFLKKPKPGDTKRKFELDQFKIDGSVASESEVKMVKFRGISPPERVLNSIRSCIGHPGDNPNIIREGHYHYDSSLEEACDNVYLDGYWQSERYFASIEKDIKEEFTLLNPMVGENLRLSEAIREGTSVSIHVRRGDYIRSEKTRRFHGVCSKGYYQRCVGEVSKRVASPHFFVFSDDPGWAENNLDFSTRTTVVAVNPPHRGHEDLRLMNQCRHHILANSSFSWWGAWLSPYPDKLVYAPGKWFADPGMDTRDLIPEAWIQI